MAAAFKDDSALGEESRLIRAIASAAMLSIEKAQVESTYRARGSRLVRPRPSLASGSSATSTTAHSNNSSRCGIRLSLAAEAIDGAPTVRRRWSGELLAT